MLLAPSPGFLFNGARCRSSALATKRKTRAPDADKLERVLDRYLKDVAYERNRERARAYADRFEQLSHLYGAAGNAWYARASYAAEPLSPSWITGEINRTAAPIAKLHDNEGDEILAAMLAELAKMENILRLVLAACKLPTTLTWY